MGVINFVKVLLKNPNNPQSPKKTYAQAQSRGEYDIDKLAKHMADHGSPYSRGTIQAITTDLVDCVRELICDGNIVRLGELGTFNVTLISQGICESMIDRQTGLKPVFTAQNITDVKARFTPGKYLTNMREGCEFNEVQSKKLAGESLAEKHKQIADGTWKGDKGSATIDNSGTNEVE